MFKAAVEYTMGDAITTRSLIDQHSLIEKNILDGHTKIKKPKAAINIQDDLLENSADTRKPSTALPVAQLNPRSITKDLLIRCNVVRNKN